MVSFPKLLFSFLFLFFSWSALFSYPTVSQSVKEKHLYPMGQKLYHKFCKKIDVDHYMSYDSMQQEIREQKLCTPMKEKYFQALSLYLWDKLRVHKGKIVEKKIIVNHTEKCPICGMYVYKYPRWATQIFYKNNHHSFDGIKDMMKYYFVHQEGIEQILVRDYYTQKVLDAKQAYYVIGSDVYGPMGNELIAFGDEKSAKVFYMDHKGKKVVQFHQITFDMVSNL